MAKGIKTPQVSICRNKVMVVGLEPDVYKLSLKSTGRTSN